MGIKISSFFIFLKKRKGDEMKRLVKYITIYHTTTYDRWLKIKKDDYLIPQGSEGAGINFNNITEEEWKDYDGYLFFSTTLEEAKNYASYFDDKVVILELFVPTHILLPDKSDCWDCETWEESAEKTEQVCIEGKLSTHYIKKIYPLNNR